MSARDDLREQQEADRERARGRNHDASPDYLRQELTVLLGIEQVGRTVIGAAVFGRGPAASVDLYLSGDTKVTFERFGDIAKGPALTAHLMSTLGVAKSFRATDAVLAGSLIFKLAKHHGEDSADGAAREWGSEFLRLAAVGEVELNDQASRWRAFSALERLNPAHDTGEDRSAHALASASVVLLDGASGARLVRCGWFLSYVRREVGGMYSPATLGTQMERVGWRRQGTEGRIKATCPSDSRRWLNWRFYMVSRGWDEQ